MSEDKQTEEMPYVKLNPLGRQRVQADARKKKLAQVQREQRALALRAAGLNYDGIARELGISPSTAFETVNRALVAAMREPAAAVIEREVTELDGLRGKAVQVLGRAMADPNTDRALRVIETLLKIAESRRKLLGLNAPARADVRVTNGEAIPVVGMSPEEFNAALQAGLRHLRGQTDVVDVVPKGAEDAPS